MPNIRIIAENDLCISCGACFHICPKNNLAFRFNSYSGKWEPTVIDQIRCSRCKGDELCLSVCPSYNVNYMELAGSDSNKLLGKIENIYTGFSNNHHIRYSSSSGGFIREACLTLLKKFNIDGIISITHDQDLEYTPKLITDVNLMPNSVYHNINYKNAMSVLFNNEGKFILIGLPCQIASIELLTKKKKYSDQNKKIFIKIALMCGYSFDRKNIYSFANYNKFNLKEVTYRERGRYRKTRIKNDKTNMIFEAYFPKNVKEKINNAILFDNFLSNTGCLYCVDHSGYCADLVVGDAWLESYLKDDIGSNIIISRTKKGEQLVKQMDSFCFYPGSHDDIISSQSSLYALGAIGEGMKAVRFHKQKYIPQKIRTNRISDIETYQFKYKDLIKIKIIKRLLKKEKYTLARYLYILIHYRSFLIQLKKDLNL